MFDPKWENRCDFRLFVLCGFGKSDYRMARAAGIGEMENSGDGQKGNGRPAQSGGSRFAGSDITDLIKLVFLLLFGIAPFFAAVFLLGFQIWGWFGTGLWPAWSVIDGLKLVSSAPWLVYPTSQFLIHAILGALPLSLALAGLALVSFRISNRFG